MLQEYTSASIHATTFDCGCNSPSRQEKYLRRSRLRNVTSASGDRKSSQSTAHRNRFKSAKPEKMVVSFDEIEEILTHNSDQAAEANRMFQ